MNDLSFLFKLSPAERIQLAMDLWDSLPIGDEAMPPLTEAQMAELDRRLARGLEVVAHVGDARSARRALGAPGINSEA